MANLERGPSKIDGDLKEARVKRAEHQAAAERHGALNQLYAERISCLETQLGKVVPARSNRDDSESLRLQRHALRRIVAVMPIRGNPA